MIKFLLGVITGIVISTVGLAGLVNFVDAGVQKVQEASKELVR